MVSQLKEQSVIESFFKKSVDRMTKDSAGMLMSDLFVQTDAETGEIQLYDENKSLLNKMVIFNWLNTFPNKEAFDINAINTIKPALDALNAQGLFEQDFFLKPFSISITDENFSVIEELLFVDDELLRLDDPLLKDLDKDLDDFLNSLLADI